MTRFCEEWLLLPERIALHEPTATVVIADLHLGYSAARQRMGDAIPVRGMEEELQPLMVAARTRDIRQLIIAGDLFERGFDEELNQRFLGVLERLRIRLLAVVPGNHDRGIEKQEHALPLFSDGFDFACWHVCHGDQPVEKTRVIMGHWHPAVRVGGRKQPCFLTRGTRLILPAFSLDAAGVDVRRDSRWDGWEHHGIGAPKQSGGRIRKRAGTRSQ